jgi:RNA polymerase-interacting CarD/CdnL/TRCF family regulator
MSDYSQEKWMELYQTALFELKHSLMAGRIMDARAEIVKRLERLQQMPDLHSSERQAIADALSSLRYLEREDAKYAAGQQRAAVQTALEKLGSIAPKIESRRSNQPEEN